MTTEWQKEQFASLAKLGATYAELKKVSDAAAEDIRRDIYNMETDAKALEAKIAKARGQIRVIYNELYKRKTAFDLEVQSLAENLRQP